MSGRVGELVLLIVALRKCNEDPQIVLPRSDFDACASKLGRNLVEASRRESLLGTIDEESRYRWMMRCLFSEV
jgi:hypothetical protein